MNTPTENRISKWVKTWLSTQGKPETFELTPLAGDGSSRCFFRVSTDDSSYVLVSDPGWVFSKDYAAHQAYLTQRKVPVPQFYSVDAGEGFGLMEDLGDVLLQKKILDQPAKRLTWLIRASTLLADLHGASHPIPSSLPVASRHFDSQKYQDELRFTFEHLHQKFLGLEEPASWEPLMRFCKTIGEYKPEVFTHRDYHTRNILVKDDLLYLIDFQDARLGPVEYDLASLIFDPYVPTNSEERDELISSYQFELKRYPLSNMIPWSELSLRLEMVGFQRLIKAAGSFASFVTRYSKRTHLPYLIPCLQTAQSLYEKRREIRDNVGDFFPISTWIEKAKPLVG